MASHNERIIIYNLRHNLSDILKLQPAFLYSIYHQRAGETSLFHRRGVDFTHFNTCCTFKDVGMAIVFLVTSDYYFAQAVKYNGLLLVRHVSYVPCVHGHSRSHPKHTFNLAYLHVLQPGSLIRNKVQHTAVLVV